MVDSIQNKAFINDKNQFFAHLRLQKDTNAKIIEAEKLANKKDYEFLLKNQGNLETEFKLMFAVLKKQKDKNNEAFWSYCYYCATMLETFYKAYSQQAKAEEYQKLKQQIKDHLLKTEAEEKKKKDEESFIAYLENCFISGFRNIINIPFHISAIRDYVAFSNLCRVYWVFCRLTLTNGLLLAKELQLIEALDAILGTHTNVDKIISTLQAPNGVLNYFSVGLFLIRFIIDTGLLIRHTFFPTEAERKAPAWERFKYEVKKRHCNNANDLVWALVNFLTNFNHITNIPGPIAGAITAVFLCFDLSMFIYKRHLAQQDYLAKKAQFLQQIDAYTNSKKFAHLSADERLQHITMLNKQLAALEIDWQTKDATFYFACAAATLFVLGFTSALLFSPAGIVVASFFVCTLGAAMYLSIGTYSKYKETSLNLQQAELTEHGLAAARKEYESARNDFIFTLVKNTVMPTLLIATFAICWPAAIALTVAYMGFELFHSYNQHSNRHEVNKLAAVPEEESVIDLTPSLACY